MNLYLRVLRRFLPGFLKTCGCSERWQGYVKVGMSTLSRPAGRIEGCGVEPFTPFDTRSARGTLWVQDAHFCDFDLALRKPLDSVSSFVPSAVRVSPAH